MKIGIVGNGFVGQSTQLLSGENIEALVYDIVPGKCNPIGTTLGDIGKCDLAFVCVPTPSSKNGTCHTGYVKTVVTQLKEINSDCDIIIRSTVPPGTSRSLECNHMPEFLREKSWKQDFISSKEWIIGCYDFNNDIFQDKISQLFGLAKEAGSIESDSIIFATTETSEMVKYARNSYLSIKVSFFNEIESLCQRIGIDYEEARELITLDERITESHTHVPGHDGKRGYSGTCLPKDILALAKVFESNDLRPIMLEASILRNITIDRKEKDWEQNKGRSVI